MSSPARDALRLKMSGLACTAVGLVAIGFLGDAMAEGDKLLAAAPRAIVLFSAAWLAATHLIALGLILLLAGLQGVPLLTSARARHGAWRKLGGSTLLILCFVYVGLEDIPAFAGVYETWWIAAPSLALFVVSARTGVLLVRSGWKYEVMSAEQLLATDPRPPVVYLRSFEADNEILLRPDGLWRKAMALITYLAAISPEQELAMILNRVGPVIAIGKPGEPLPELGASRLYVGDADWKAKVADMMERSRLVVIRGGPTPNLWWEIEQTMARVPHRQIVLVSLGSARQTAAFDQHFEQRFGRALPRPDAADPPFWLRLIAGSQGQNTSGKIIYFDESLRAREEPIRISFSWAGLALGLVRPYRDSIQSAMKHVFASLGLPWTTRRTQAAAVFLALFGGIFGLHYFYLRDRRRGFKYLAFFWIGIPMLLGWFDTVRLARLDPGQFDEKYGARSDV